MNSEQVEGNWKQFTGMLRQRWGKLTDDDLEMARGNRQILAGRLQERYGMAKEKAEDELNHLLDGATDEVATEGSPVDMATLKKGM